MSCAMENSDVPFHPNLISLWSMDKCLLSTMDTIAICMEVSGGVIQLFGEVFVKSANVHIPKRHDLDKMLASMYALL